MIEVLVAGVMWTLVASLLILRRGRADRSITYASTAIALSMSLNINPIYLALDPLLGASNVVTLAADALLMIGLFFLGRGVMKADTYRPHMVRIAVGPPVLIFALSCVIVLFLFIDRGETTTTFMRDLGAQTAAGIYSMTVFTYCGVVVAAMLVLAGRQFRLARGVLRVPAALLAAGSVCGIALCVTVLIMDITHVVGALNVMNVVGAAYGPLTIATFLLLCAGFIAQPATRFVMQRLRAVITDALVAQIEPVWREATCLRPGLSGKHPTAGLFEQPEARLHRQVVEIRDAMIDPRVTFFLNKEDRALLERAENHLLGLKAPNAKTTQSSASSRKTVSQ